MKKTYIQPAIDIVALTTANVIATSPSVSNQDSETSRDNLGRRREVIIDDDYWDEE